MFVSFRKCSRPQKPDPISDRNYQNLYPFSDLNGSKTIPLGAAHTYIPYIGEYPPPPREYNTDSVKWFSLVIEHERCILDLLRMNDVTKPSGSGVENVRGGTTW